MTGKIYLIQGDETLQPMVEQPYIDERRPQLLLEKYPELLAGEQVDETAPRRWLLVGREIGVPDVERDSRRGPTRRQHCTPPLAAYFCPGK